MKILSMAFALALFQWTHAFLRDLADFCKNSKKYCTLYITSNVYQSFIGVIFIDLLFVWCLF